MNDSILNNTKQLLGIENDYDAFDVDIIIYINSALMQLAQSGVGKEGYYIEDSTSIWSDFLGDYDDVRAIATYVYLYVRSIFDPPSNSFVMEAIQSQMNEILWRLTIQVEEGRMPQFRIEREQA